MIIGRIEGTTRVLGQSQGYLGLPIRDEVIETVVDGPKTPVMLSAWHPTPDEVAAIARGAPIYLQVVGQAHPPVLIFVGEPADVELSAGAEVSQNG